MKEHSQKQKEKIKLFSGLGRTLTLSFLMFALIPMAVISIISYQNADISLRKEKELLLTTSAVYKKQEICTYFKDIITDLAHQAETDSNITFLTKLENAYQASGKPVEAFVKSYKWAIIVDEFGSDIKKFRKVYNYHDIFLINNNGDTLFTVAGEDDLGTNLFTGRYSKTKFSAAVRSSIETGRLNFSDYERYGPSNNLIFGFLSCVIVNREGDRIGAIVFQLPVNAINQIMQEKTGLGKTAETYLVGSDLTLRSESILDRKKNLLDEKILTEQMKLMKHDEDIHIKERGHSAFIYKGPHGRPVFGIHDEFEVQEVPFAIVAEIGEKEAFARVYQLRRTMLLLVGLTGFMAAVFIMMIVRRIVRPVLKLSSGAKKVEQGDLGQTIEVDSKNEIGELADSFNAMVGSLNKTMDEKYLQDWLKTGQMELGTSIGDISDISKLSRSIVTFLAKYLNADVGAMYIVEDEKCLNLTGTYAFFTRKHLSNKFDFGQGLVGQAALEKQRIILTHVPDDYIAVQSGLGEATPRCIVVHPCEYNNEVVGVIELGAIELFSIEALQLLDLVSGQIAVAVNTILAHAQVEKLLKKTQIQAMELSVQQEELKKSNKSLEKQARILKKSRAELQAQKEELRTSNENLEKQTLALRKSETELQAQQEELLQSNDTLSAQSSELEEQTAQLEEQKNEIQKQNIELENAKEAVEKKAKDLEVASRYKSEFLANMSHELRTPLNSILLLSKHLADNRDGNMTEKQVDCAATVNMSGNELLSLINEVLDLSKVEAGKMDLELKDTAFKDITGTLERNFKPVADEKGIDFNINVADGLPETIRTDAQRLSQILKNLLSNAFKFTEKGIVTLEICRPDSDGIDSSGKLAITDKAIVFSVKDTGPGIPEDKQDVVFQAFKQADGSTSRNYGGTGLGLSISREYAGILGGELQLSSSQGKGCTFSLYLPETFEGKPDDSAVDSSISEKSGKDARRADSPKSQAASNLQEKYISDDRKTVSSDSRSMLIIEDDPKFAKILRDVAREKGFKALVAESGEIGLHMTDCYSPDGIILDMGLPGIDGMTVISRLKENLSTRHIPVHVISASDSIDAPMQMGAVGYFTKPVTMETLDSAFGRIAKVVSKKVKEVLVVEDEIVTQRLVKDLIESDTVNVTVARTGQEAKTLIGQNDFDCIILDLGLPDISGIELLVELKKQYDLQTPVIIHTARDLTPDESVILDTLAESIVIKNAKSREKLLDETTLFLHRVEAEIPEEKRKMLHRIHDKEAILENKKIMVVDDDMRNVFALMNILEDKGVKTIVANNGKESLAKLKENPDTDLVLMDIMMPEMDGYTAMEEIRKMEPEFSKVPIITLTAKAMKGDREKSIKAGASDYLAKPVDADKLLSMLRVWLY